MILFLQTHEPSWSVLLLAGMMGVGLPGRIFSRTIKLMLERQKSSFYQHEMLLECAKITPYQQDMSH